MPRSVWRSTFSRTRRSPLAIARGRQRAANQRRSFARRLIGEELEERQMRATFAEVGTLLNLDLNVANVSVAIVSVGTSYSLTLTGDTWNGTNSVNVTGFG